MVHSRRTILSKLQTPNQAPPVTSLGKLKARKSSSIPPAPLPQPTVPHITALVRRPGSNQTERLQSEQIKENLRERGTLLWIDIADPGQAQLIMLNREFDFSPLSLEDALKQRQRPKVDEYPNYYFIVM